MLYHEKDVSGVGSHAYVFEKYKYQATFKEKFNLQELPYDQQDLVIKITAEREGQSWVAVDGGCGQKTRVPAEWSIQNGTQQELEIYEPKPGQVWQQCRARVHLQRNPSFFLKHVVLVSFFQSLASALVLLVQPSKVKGGSWRVLILSLIAEL